MSIASTTQKVQELATNADPLGTSIKFTFNDAEGVVFINGQGDSNQVHNQDEPAECTITVSQADLDGMISGSLNPMMAFTMGKLKIDGDMGAAMKLAGMFS
jgi:putative sterol carrier protein